MKSSGVASRDVDALFRRILLSADRGNWPETWKDVEDARREAAKVGPDVQRRFTLVDASLHLSVDPDATDVKGVRDQLRPTVEWISKASDEYRSDAQLDALMNQARLSGPEDAFANQHSIAQRARTLGLAVPIAVVTDLAECLIKMGARIRGRSRRSRATASDRCTCR